ncbi:hypothetical protein OIU76_000338 [Salix suchowensis]|uniref:Uncharacterized protein n=1 Tax=Salix suchowensis TaxID=1278906 RepID=A0ABQ9B5T5_9ROSI|nr:hypothetical protein OIU76_000338 [Salix suchowensis]KAJ6375276.1 hypothetical protein OIU77_000291 [Salix suchowensis]
MRCELIGNRIRIRSKQGLEDLARYEIPEPRSHGHQDRSVTHRIASYYNIPHLVDLIHFLKDRKSGTGLSGSPKKGGHGGKFTWVGDGYSQAEMGSEKEAVDVKDPNFEDPEEIKAV